MARRGYLAALLFIGSASLAGCATARPVELEANHPANPAAPESPAGPSPAATLGAYRPAAELARNQPRNRPQPDQGAMPGMDHGAMGHDAPQPGHEGMRGTDHGAMPGVDQSTTAEAGAEHAGPAAREHAEDAQGHDHGGAAHGHGRSAAGAPGQVSEATRTIRLEARDILFDVKRLDVKPGETVRFVVTNTGKLPHEFVIGTPKEQAEHRAMMQRMPDMAHNEPNAVSLGPGETRELVWRFSGTPDVEFACNVPGHAEAGMRGEIKVRR